MRELFARSLTRVQFCFRSLMHAYIHTYLLLAKAHSLSLSRHVTLLSSSLLSSSLSLCILNLPVANVAVDVDVDVDVAGNVNGTAD